MKKTPRYWLLKSEPETYSFEQLKKEKGTDWNGIRNFQARNFIREISPGDLCLIYHSGKERSVIGIAKVVSEPFPDLDPKKPGEWLQFKISYHQELKHPVTLHELKSHSKLKNLLLIKQSRLSTMPVTEDEFKLICDLGNPTK